jgi:murein DD-endopeptidase MepM/ murein hydrolase activator NlpD
MSMSHHAPRYNRAQLAAEANQRAQLPEGSLTFSWRSRHGTRSTSHPYLLVGSVAAIAVVLSVWGAAVTSYLVFKDDIIGGLMNRQAAIQHAYEDRIRDLRSQVDRLVSRQMVDQTEIERRVEQVARRQAVLETRQSIVTSLNEAAGVRGPAGAETMPLPIPSPIGSRPAPIGDTLRLAPPVDRQSRLESRVVPSDIASAPAGPATQYALASVSPARPAKTDTIARLEHSLDQVEQRQARALQSLETRAERRAKRIRAVLADLGLDQTRTAPITAHAQGGTGGPLIPIPQPTGDTTPFERQVFRLQTVIRDHDRLNRLVTTIPLGRPHDGETELSSGFGPRLDPFLRTWAMHSGIDFRGSTGEPARVTAAGRVTHASSMGGYGLMVEVDHGNGLSTRYAHLSRIDVSVGDMVRLGQRIGRIGSTGRSTGPHLHYETRVNGEAVDPMRFVRAGLRLATAD